MSAAARPGPPLWLLAELTYRCPLHCVFCYNPVDFATQADELSTDRRQNLFDHVLSGLRLTDQCFHGAGSVGNLHEIKAHWFLPARKCGR